MIGLNSVLFIPCTKEKTSDIVQIRHCRVCLKKGKRVSVEWGRMDAEVRELKTEWCEEGKGEKIERRTRIVIDCVPSPETVAGVQAKNGRRGT